MAKLAGTAGELIFDVKINIDVKVKLWDAIKIRIAGKNIKELNEVLKNLRKMKEKIK